MKIICHTIGPIQANCYVLVAEDSGEAVVIDPGQGITPVIDSLENLKVVLILLTHGHFDHLAGVARVKEVAKAPVMIHRAEAQWLTDPELNGSLDMANGSGPVIGPKPDGLLTDGQQLEWAGPAITCLHTPGHTPGGTSFYIPDQKVVLTGDTLFAGSIGRSDLPGGNHAQLLNSIREKLLSLSADVQVYPGHLGTTTIGQERQSNPFLRRE